MIFQTFLFLYGKRYPVLIALDKFNAFYDKTCFENRNQEPWKEITTEDLPLVKAWRNVSPETGGTMSRGLVIVATDNTQVYKLNWKDYVNLREYKRVIMPFNLEELEAFLRLCQEFDLFCSGELQVSIMNEFIAIKKIFQVFFFFFFFSFITPLLPFNLYV